MPRPGFRVRVRRRAPAWPEENAHRPLRLRPAARAHCAAARASARRGAAAGGAAGQHAPRSKTAACAILPDLLQPGDCLVVNDTRSSPPRLKGRRIGRGRHEPAIEATLHKRIDGSHWRAFILGAKKVQVGDVLRFGDEGKVCFLGQLDAQVSGKDEGGEVTLSFAFHGPVLEQAIAERGEMPLPPYIAVASASRTSRTRPTTRPSLRARRARSRRPPPACISRRNCLSGSHATRHRRSHSVTLHVGAGHVPAGEGGRHRRPQNARRVRA